MDLANRHVPMQRVSRLNISCLTGMSILLFELAAIIRMIVSMLIAAREVTPSLVEKATLLSLGCACLNTGYFRRAH